MGVTLDELKSLKIGDETNITVSAFGQNFSLQGVISEIKKKSIVLQQNENNPEILFEQIVQIKKLRKNERERESESESESESERINQLLGYVFFKKNYKCVNEKCVAYFYKNESSYSLVNLLDVLKDLILVSDENSVSSKILGDLYYKVGEFTDPKFQWKDVLYAIKENLLHENLNFREKINVYKFCRNFFYLLQYGYVWEAFDTGNIEETYPTVDPSWFDDEYSLKFLNLIRYYKDVRKEWLLKRFDEILNFTIFNICHLLMNKPNEELVDFINKYYCGLYEHILYLRAAYIRNVLKFSEEDCVNRFCIKNIPEIDLFIRILIANNLFYDEKGALLSNLGYVIVNNISLNCENKANLADLYALVHESNKFKILIYSKTRDVYMQVMMLFHICLVFSNNYDCDLLLSSYKVLENGKDYNCLKDLDFKFLRLSNHDLVVENSSVQERFKNFKSVYNELSLCYRVLYSRSRLDLGTVKVDYVRRIRDLLLTNPVSKLIFDQELHDSILEFCKKFESVFDLKIDCKFQEREKILIGYSEPIPKMLKGRENLICGSFYEKCRMNRIFGSKESLFSLYFFKKPNVDIICYTNCLSYSNNWLYFPILISNHRNVREAYIKSINFGIGTDQSAINYINDIECESAIAIENSILFDGESKGLIVSFHINEEYDNPSCFMGSVFIRLIYEYKDNYDFDVNQFRYAHNEKAVNFDFDFNLSASFSICNVYRNFCSGSVISNDSMFFGRNDDLDSIISNLSVDNGVIIQNRCFCIYGQTRTGKSSLLYHLKKRFRQTDNNVIVDLGDIGSLDVSDSGFRYAVLSELSNEICFEHTDLENIFVSKNFNLEPDFDDLQKNPALYFDRYLKKFRRILDRYAPKTQIIIMIDEFTYIYDWIKMGKVSDDFMKFWKGLIQNYRLCAIVVGQDHMMKFINDSRFTNCFGAVQTYEVTYLKPEYARQLVTVPVSEERCGENSCRFAPEAVDYFVGLTAGSAYLLMNLCSDFIDYMNGMNAKYATLPHVEDFVRRHLHNVEERLFEPLFNDKMDLDSEDSIGENKRILAKIAHATADRDSVKLEDLKISDSDRTRIDHLTARHVLQYEGGGYRILVKLYAMWLRRMTEKEDA